MERVKLDVIVLFCSLLTIFGCGKEGPSEVQPEKKWESLGLEEEEITAIAVNPNKQNIIYAGIRGKLFKTTDSGKTWDTLVVGMPFLTIDIILDPLHPETLYVISPILKSTNGGKTWLRMTSGLRIPVFSVVRSFAIDPKNTQILYAGTGGISGGTLHKSVDAGLNWNDLYRSQEETPRLQNGVTSLSINPKDPSIIYAGTAGDGSIVKSSDAGITWKITGMESTGRLVFDIEIDPSFPEIIYSALSYKGFWKSENAGINWYPYNMGLPDSINGIHIILDPVKFVNYGVVSFGDDGWIYSRIDQSSGWQKLGINNLRRSYYYSDLVLTQDGKTLYFCSKGLYKYN